MQEAKPEAYQTERTLLVDDRMTETALDVVNKIRLMEKNIDDNENIIQKTRYKLAYVYGSKLFIHFLKIFSAFYGIFFVALYFFLNISPTTFIMAGFLGIAGTLLWINRLFDKKIARFLDNFVYAMDIIVRGVRNGLAFNICLKQTIADLDYVVAEQFIGVLDDYKIGLSTNEVMERFMKRMPLKEVKFFCLSIIIQNKTGGNLAEIISNLSTLLRDRKTLLIKIRTASAEAVTAAWVMSALPIFVFVIISIMSPDYVKPFYTESGKIVLLCCLVWMALGGLIMRKMINFIK